MRADVNLSVRPVGQEEFGTRTEMKNIASLRAIERAIEYERERQIDEIEAGRKIVQETRRWDDEREFTYAMRSKEDAQDYKYFPDPDLMPIEISEEYLEEVKANLPEFADQKRDRYINELGLPEYDADIITGSTALVKIFERTAELCGNPKDASNWVMGDMLKLCNDNHVTPEEVNFNQDSLGAIIKMVQEGKINRKTGQKVFAKVFEEDVDPAKYVEENGLAQVSDLSAIEPAIKEVLANNEKAVNEYLGGNEKNFQFLIGQSMRSLKGKADPQAVRQTLQKLLDELK